MFTDTFALTDKYDFSTGEKISTIERMPRRFTSLKDWQYLPDLDQTVVDKLNLFFDYKVPHTPHPIKEADKLLDIEYTDDGIQSFFCVMPINWSVIADPINIWRQFAKKTENPELLDKKSVADKMMDMDSTSILSGLLYDKDAKCTGFRLFCPHFTLDDYPNDDITRLNLIAKNSEVVHGSVSVLHNQTFIGYKTSFHLMGKTLFDNNKKGYFTLEDKTPTSRQHVIDTLLNEEFITEDEKAFIETICTGNSYFTLEHVVSQDGELLGKHLLHHRIETFKDLTQG